jgi:DNA-binding transcriptional LysR family regulator
LTPAGRRKLADAEARVDRAERDLAEARRQWAKVVRSLGMSAVAREKDATVSAISERVRYWEDRSSGT